MSLRIGVIKTVPLTTNCSLEPTCENRGFAVDAAQIVCKILSFNCTFVWYAGDGYGSVDENGLGTGMVGAIQRGEFDTSLPVFTPTFERFRAISFSGIYSFNDVLLATRAPQDDQGRTWNIVYAFHWSLWFLFLWSMGATASSVLLYQKLLMNESPLTNFNLLSDLLGAFGSLTTNKHRHDILRFDAVRVISIFWSLVGLVFSSSYTSVLFSQRLVQGNELPFTDLETLVRCLEEVRCRIVASPLYDSSLQLLTTPNTPLSDRMNAALKTNPIRFMPSETIVEETLKEKNRFLVSVWEEKAFYYNTDGNNDCLLYTINAPYLDVGTFPLKKGSRLQRVLTKTAAPFLENGLGRGLLLKYEGSARTCGAREWKNSRLQRPWHGQYLLGAVSGTFYVYFIGLSVASSALILEKWLNFRNRRRVICHGNAYEAYEMVS